MWTCKAFTIQIKKKKKKLYNMNDSIYQSLVKQLIGRLQ